MRRRVAQRVAQLANRRVQALIKINKGFVGPNLFPQFFAGDEIPGPLEQHPQHLKRLLLELDPNAALAQLTGREVGFKDAETHDATL